ncbi:MAG: phage tail sheath protein FI [Crocinitomicaceae bacterium]|jgi:phage tail sheath protein FI
MTLQTPGVYIKETNNFPPSIVEASTAVPVFIGFTEIVPMDNGSTPQPVDNVLISNMLDFIASFGGEFPVEYEVDGSTPETVKANYNFYLYDSLDLYFRNGGGPCFVISAGEFSDASSETLFKGAMDAAITKVEAAVDATIVVAPDLHVKQDGLPIGAPGHAANYKLLSSKILNICGAEKDKFALFDYISMASDSLEMRNQITPASGNLKYGALYYPWLKNAASTAVSYDEISFDPAGSALTSPTTLELDKLIIDLQSFKTDFTTGTSSSQLQEEYLRLVRAFDNQSTATVQKAALTAIFQFVTDLVSKLDGIEQAPNGSVELTSRFSELKMNADFIVQVRKLFELVNLLRDKLYVLKPASNWNYTSIQDDYWYNQSGATTLDPLGAISELAAGLIAPIDTGAKSKEEVLSDFTSGLYVNYQLIFTSVAGLVNALNHRKQQLEQRLFSEDAGYIAIKEAIEKNKSEIPSQGAIAGVYCANDRDRGVWKSPANVAVQGIEKPMVEVSNREQDNLNVDVNSGKSINVIRTFTGKGALVWGARTLAGNDNEWRYISVRRFFNFAEESIGKSLQDFVFEPNSALTWVKIQAMITSFLVTQWQLGALVGVKMDEAFFVRLGEDTTTPAEINNGIINIQIGLAVARPAEFIVIEFNHYLKS